MTMWDYQPIIVDWEYTADLFDSGYDMSEWSGWSAEAYVDSLEEKVDLSAFAPDIRPVGIVDTLPGLPSDTYPEGSIVYNKEDGKIYRSTGNEWTAEVPLDELTGQITETQIADDSISTPKLQTGSVTAANILAGSIGTDQLAANSVTAGIIAAGAISSTHIATEGLDAGIITTGSLQVGGLEGIPDALEVLNTDGQQIGIWNNDGLLITDAFDPNLQVRLASGFMEFSYDGGQSWTTAISGRGITADSITIGRLPGGHNNIPNSGFEVTAFVQPASKVWTLAGDWATTIGTDVNIDKTTGDLKMLDYLY